jgi:hypothetical protein
MTSDGATAFVGSTGGILFAFNTSNGELESYQQVGSEIRRLALSEKSHSVAVVRSSPAGDEVSIISFDVVASDGANPSSPTIASISPEIVEQGRLGNLKLEVVGRNFTEGASLVVNGVEMGADLIRNGGALEARLPKSLFNQTTVIKVLVKGADGTLSQPRELKVVRPDLPVIDHISPSEVPGPTGPFLLRVTGKNFRASSAIVVDGHPLNTQQIGSSTLQAKVPADIAEAVKSGVKVQVRDLTVPDLVSANEKELQVFGPRVTELKPTVPNVVAGGRSFGLRIAGYNFREGAQVDLRVNGDVFTAMQVQRFGSRILWLTVPTHIVQESGTLAVIVRNPDGSTSEPKELEVRAPEITSFAQDRVFAGSPNAQIDIRGKSFRRNARVYVGNARVENSHVRFRSSSHLTVTLDGDLTRLLEKPSTLKFQVVNPNNADGVPSADKGLAIVGPEIAEASVEAAQEDSAQLRVIIQGANFTRNSTVEFFKVGMEDAPVIQQKPQLATDGKLIVSVSAKKLERMGKFRVRVINPGNVASRLVQPRPLTVASTDD